jgi:hypothetical protein
MRPVPGSRKGGRGSTNVFSVPAGDVAASMAPVACCGPGLEFDSIRVGLLTA